MSNNHPPLYYEFLRQAGSQIAQAVDKSLPQGVVKNFMLWMLDNNNPSQESYLRMLGVAGSVELELKLLENILEPSIIKEMAYYISILNAYFGFETLSDNLGVGLSPIRQRKTLTQQAQKEVLLKFNKIMIKKIKGFPKKSANLLADSENLIKKISVNKTTLSPEQMHNFCKKYCEYNHNVDSSKLEYSFLSILILNIETCLQLLNSLQKNPIYWLLKDSVIGRYAAVNRIVIASSSLSLKKLAELGLKSILTIPTLAYCVGALEEVKPNKAFKKVIESGLVHDCMADAALLTRLLNDIGTHLLEMHHEERNHCYQQYKNYLGTHNDDSIFSYLLRLSKRKEFMVSLTRIRKDLKHGEFNICLDKLQHDKPLTESFVQFCKTIDYYAKLYQKHYQTMLKNLSELSDRLNDEYASKIIYNFVYFHQIKYSQAFDSMEGDYAITKIKKEHPYGR